MLQELINKLQEELPGYHFALTCYPSGGMIDADGCEECGTEGGATVAWKYGKGEVRSLDDAVTKLKIRLEGA